MPLVRVKLELVPWRVLTYLTRSVVSVMVVVSANRDWQYMRLHSRRPVLSMIVDILAGVKVNKILSAGNDKGWGRGLRPAGLIQIIEKGSVAYICNK